MNRLPACIFDVNEMGNMEFTWSGLNGQGSKPPAHNRKVLKFHC